MLVEAAFCLRFSAGGVPGDLDGTRIPFDVGDAKISELFHIFLHYGACGAVTNTL
jgi:hypothetical protein